jgi:mRNA degradation ribonuclease J1/J2
LYLSSKPPIGYRSLLPPAQVTRTVEAAAAAKPIAMLCEGTNLVGADFSTEDEVRAKIGKLVGTTQNLVLATFRHTDVDRTRTLYEVAKSNHRKLAVSMRQAYVMKKLEADRNLDLPRVDSDDFLVFRLPFLIKRFLDRIVSKLEIILFTPSL